MDETQHGEASPGSTAYERGRFTVQDYPALQQTQTPRHTPSVSNNAAAAEAMAMALAPQAAGSPMVVYGHGHGPGSGSGTAPQYVSVLRPVFVPTARGSPLVVPHQHHSLPQEGGVGSPSPSPSPPVGVGVGVGVRDGGYTTFTPVGAGAGAGLDQIRLANVQHQKLLRDLIIFHRPPGDAVLPSADVPAKLDRVGELVAALDLENQQLAAEVAALRAECEQRGLPVPETLRTRPHADDFNT